MSMGSIGQGIAGTTNLLGSFVDAKGAVHSAETQANAGEAAIGTEQNAYQSAIQADAYQTEPERNIGTLALYQLSSMLGIDPREAFPGGIPGDSAGEYPGGNASDSSGGGYSSDQMYSRFGGFSRDPLQVFKNYHFNPATFGSPESLMGERPKPGAPGAEFGSLRHRFSMADFFNNVDPAYGFRLSQGQQGIESSAAARGMQLSGSNLKDLDTFSQGLASEEYQNAFNRFQQQQNNDFNRLSQLAGNGQNASAALGSTAANLLSQAGNNIANIQLGQGNVLAAGQAGATQAISGAIRQSGQDVAGVMGGMGGMGAAKPPSSGGSGGSDMSYNYGSDTGFGGGSYSGPGSSNYSIGSSGNWNIGQYNALQ